MIHYDCISTPIGVKLQLAVSDRGLCWVGLGEEEAELAHPLARRFGEEAMRDAPAVAQAAEALRAYFAGALRAFDLPLDLRGTRFQLQVWAALRAIPYGETRSYRQVAAQIGRPTAVRAVAAANAANPLAIVVPCHRVIGSDGSLKGYAGGLPLKQALLELEARHRSMPGSAR